MASFRFRITPFPVSAAMFPLLYLSITIGTIAYFLSISAARENETAADASRHLARTALESVNRTTANWTKDYAWWDETLEKASGEVDEEWAEGNVGTYLQETFGISGSFLIDPTLATTFFSPKGDNAHSDALAFLGDHGLTFLNQVQATSMAESIPLTTLVRSNERVYLVAAAAITPENPTEAELVRHARPILILYRAYDVDLVDEMGTQFLLKNLVVNMIEPAPGMITQELNNFAGKPIAYAHWIPARPGDTLISELLPRISFISALLVVGTLLVFLYWWRSVSQDNEAKSSFLAKMSHELRTPLNPILGFSEMMSDEILGPLPDRYKAYANDIHRSGQHLSVIIEGILDVSRIEAGQMELHETVFDVRELLTNLPPINKLLPPECGEQANLSRLRVRHDFDADLPMLRGDELRVRQVVLNLLSNAGKYSDGEDILLSVKFDNGSIKVTVQDRGKGISEKDIKSLFVPFVQLDDTYVRERSKGTGLGLVVSRELMQLHDGTLELESTKNVGTRAVMSFPPHRTIMS